MEKQLHRFVLVFILALLFFGCGDSGGGDKLQAGNEISASGDEARTRVSEIFSEPDRLERVARLIAALRAVPADQVSVFKKILNDPDLRFREFERLLVLTAWAKLDPPAAMHWAHKGERPGTARDAELLEAVGAWARQDPHALVDKYNVAGGLASDASTIVPLVEGWFESGQPGLEDFVMRLSNSDEGGRALNVLIRLKVERDGVNSVREWAEALPGDESPYKESVFSRVAGEMASVDPEQAVEWCEEVCDTPRGSGMQHMIAVKWAAHGGTGAMDWMLTKPPVVLNRATIRATYRQLMMSDPAGATEWMESTTEEQRRGAMLQGPVGMYITMQSRREPLVAIEWTDYLSDEDQRELALVTIARRWLRKDKEAAEDWLAQSPLSEEARNDAHNPPRRRK